MTQTPDGWQLLRRADGVAEVYDTTGRVLTLTHDSYRRFTSVRLPGGEVSTYTYDDWGRVTESSHTNSNYRHQFAYDPSGLQTEVTDFSSGTVTFYKYNERGSLTRLVQGEEVTHFTYDPRGVMTRIKTPDGSVFTLVYDADVNLTKIETNLSKNNREQSLATAVVHGGPAVSNSQFNPFGHVAIAFTGEGVYSYGTNTPRGSSLTDYLKNKQHIVTQ